MAKLHFSTVGLLLLHAIATLAAPNGPLPTAQPAHKILAANPHATPPPTPPHDLKPRAVPSSPAGETSGTSSLLIANSFTHLSNTTTSNTSSASPTVRVIATGVFTGADGGRYEVTSQSGYVVVDGKTLGAGQRALIGTQEVSEGSRGFVVGGQPITLTPVTLVVSATAASTTSSSAAVTTSGSVVSGSTTLSATVVAAGSSVVSASAAAAASSVSSKTGAAAAAVPTRGAGCVMAVAAGGLLGAMLL